MKIKFSKYQGTGNDFIIIDHRFNNHQLTHEQISFLCSRHLGVGADGLIYLEKSSKLDFKMVYYNSDGKEGSFCGNGARCVCCFAKELNLIDHSANFASYDGLHYAEIEGQMVKLKMSEVLNIRKKGEHLFLDTGSPHSVTFVDNVDLINAVDLGRKIRHQQEYTPNGVNVNFVEVVNQTTIKVRTYERGVENETLSCGTGVTASALATRFANKTDCSKIDVHAPGGVLSVNFQETANGFEDVFLIGPVQKVYEGVVII